MLRAFHATPIASVAITSRNGFLELDKKTTTTRRLQQNEYVIHTPMIDAWNSKLPSLEECPLPKFYPEKSSEQNILMKNYLSTGLSNKPDTKNDKEIIRGSFRTSIDDRTGITPSPILHNIQVDFKKLFGGVK